MFLQFLSFTLSSKQHYTTSSTKKNGIVKMITIVILFFFFFWSLEMKQGKANLTTTDTLYLVWQIFHYIYEKLTSLMGVLPQHVCLFVGKQPEYIALRVTGGWSFTQQIWVQGVVRCEQLQVNQRAKMQCRITCSPIDAFTLTVSGSQRAKTSTGYCMRSVMLKKIKSLPGYVLPGLKTAATSE